VTILLAIVSLGVLIMVHEAGHMLVARRLGMRVEKFSVGFGPPLLRWRGKHTIFQLALVPLGGFVQIAGMNPHEELPEGDAGSYANKPATYRFATVLAGPVTNYLFAILIMSGVVLTLGLPKWQHVVAEVVAGSPAAGAGLRTGDIIEAIDGAAVPAVEDVLGKISGSGGRTLAFRLRRGGGSVQARVTPAPKDRTYRIGIQFGRKLAFSPIDPGRGLLLAALFPIDESAKALSGLGQLFTGKTSVSQVGGPLEIVRQLKMSFEESLVMSLLFLAMLNVYLGLFNLLPVPALDGGRLLFLIYTMIARRPVNQRFENAVHTVGFLLILGLLALVTYRDIARMVSP
jgi:regulator of sigma E protease